MVIALKKHKLSGPETFTESFMKRWLVSLSHERNNSDIN